MIRFDMQDSNNIEDPWSLLHARTKELGDARVALALRDEDIRLSRNKLEQAHAQLDTLREELDLARKMLRLRSTSSIIHVRNMVTLAFRIVLPDILDYFAPALPRSLYSYNYASRISLYGPLLACALVCRDWTAPAQVALYRSSLVGTRTFYDPASKARIDIFLTTLCARPDLALAVRSLAIFCSTSQDCQCMRAILQRCSSVRKLVLFFNRDSGAKTGFDQLAEMEPMCSVSTLGSSTYVRLDLKLLLAIFPNIRSLHLPNFQSNGLITSLVPDSPSLGLRELHGKVFDCAWLSYFARVCKDPGIQLFHLDMAMSEDILLFKDTLEELSVWKFVEHPIKIDSIAACTKLRNLTIREGELPWHWPPNLESIEVPRYGFLRYRSRKNIRRMLATMPRLRRFTLRDDEEGVEKSWRGRLTHQELQQLFDNRNVALVFKA